MQWIERAEQIEQGRAARKAALFIKVVCMVTYEIPHWLQWLNAISFSVLLAIIAIGRLTLPVYLRKRAENLATKQDLAELTRIAERIKSDLDVQSQRRASLDNEARTAILGFYDDINHWGALATDVTLGVEETTDAVALDHAYARLFSAMRKARRSHSRFLFFVREMSLRQAANKVFETTTTLHRAMQLTILDVKKVTFELDALNTTRATTSQGLQAYVQSHKALLDKQTAILWKFANDLKTPMHDADAANDSFIEQARGMLFS